MSVTFRPARRAHQPLIIGLAGPSKSGKSLSALRLAVGLAGGRPILMLNTEPHGHHYADRFTYQACEMTPPHRPEKYAEALRAAAELQPGVVIIDTLTHMHDGFGGMLEWKDEIALAMAKGDRNKADKMNAPAWAEVKAAENSFVYTLQELHCHAILCFRAKEKVKITRDGKWIDLGWRPIMSDRIAFETMFTLMFLPYSGGVPDLSISELRWPFAELIPTDRPLDESLGETLAKWALGDVAAASLPGTKPHASAGGADPPGPPAGAGTGGMSATGEPGVFQPRSPVDDWEDQLDNVKTANQRKALMARLSQDWGTFLGPEQKRLAEANIRAMKRVGG